MLVMWDNRRLVEYSYILWLFCKMHADYIITNEFVNTDYAVGIVPVGGGVRMLVVIMLVSNL